MNKGPEASPFFHAESMMLILRIASPATLSAHFMLWLSSPEAAFLRGKLVWANWDVEELKAVGSKIREGSQMTIGVEGWPFVNTT